MKKILFLSLFVFLFIQCGDKKSEEIVGYAVESPSLKEATPSEEIMPTDISGEDRTTQVPLNPVDQKIIKTGYFIFETPSVTETFNQIKKSIEVHKGYIQNDQTGKSYNRISRSITIRIPNSGFQPVVDQLNNDVKVFDEQRVELEDVTEEFYDIEARTKAKKELENRYLQLLNKAQSVKDMLEIESQLAQIREEIEAQEGRLKYLQNRVSYSTINLTFYQMIEEQNSPSNSFISRIGKGIKTGFDGIGDFIVILFYNWPLLLIGIPAFWYFRKKYKNKPKNAEK